MAWEGQVYKVVIIGDSEVGKTSILNRFTDDSFDKKVLSTVGVDFQCRTIFLSGKVMLLQIWDTEGQDRFLQSSYRPSDTLSRTIKGEIYVFDLTNQASFDHLEQCTEQFRHPLKMPKLIVGNKCDRSDERAVTTETASKFAERVGARYFEASALDSTNIEQLFMSLAQDMLDQCCSEPDGVPLSSRTAEPSKLKIPCCWFL